MELKNAPIVAALLFAVLASGCAQQPKIIVDSVDLNVTAVATNTSEFIKAGCVNTGHGWLDCSSTGLDERFSCKEMWVPSDLGGLSPKVQIVKCNVMVENWTSETEWIVREGCLLPLYRKYIVFSDGEYKLIGSKREFVDFFAPVESPEEALAFALALTRAYPDYDPIVPGNYKVFVPEVRSTYVEKKGEDYRVHLFDMEVCGCGSHPYYSVDYIVTKSGDVTELSRERIYEDPSLFGLCID